VQEAQSRILQLETESMDRSGCRCLSRELAWPLGRTRTTSPEAKAIREKIEALEKERTAHEHARAAVTWSNK
jgi:hypothetical protein